MNEDTKVIVLQPAKKGARRAPEPAPRFSIAEQFGPDKSEAVDAAREAAQRYLGRVKCVVCGQTSKAQGTLFPTLLYKKTGAVFDVQSMYLRGPPKWRVPVVLSWFAAVCRPCIPKWMAGHKEAARVAVAERKKKLREAHRKNREQPITDKVAHKIARHYLYAALKAKSPERKRKMYIEHYRWDAKARKPV